MDTNKYSLESRKKQAKTYKFWGMLLIIVGMGMFLYAGAKMVFEPQITAGLGTSEWHDQFNAMQSYRQSMEHVIPIFAVGGILIMGLGDVLWRKYKTLSTGLYGEELVSYTLNTLPNEYTMYNNILLEKDGKRAAIDTLVISKYGVFLGEVKNYKGRISGNENDSAWIQIKKSSGGKCYENSIKNPVKQAKFQTYLLSSILKENGLNCYIHPYVVFISAEDITTDSEIVLKSENEFYNTILSYHDTKISKENLEKLKGVMECLKKSES